MLIYHERFFIWVKTRAKYIKSLQLVKSPNFEWSWESCSAFSKGGCSIFIWELFLGILFISNQKPSGFWILMGNMKLVNRSWRHIVTEYGYTVLPYFYATSGIKGCSLRETYYWQRSASAKSFQVHRTRKKEMQLPSGLTAGESKLRLEYHFFGRMPCDSLYTRATAQRVEAYFTYVFGPLEKKQPSFFLNLCRPCCLQSTKVIHYIIVVFPNIWFPSNY